MKIPDTFYELICDAPFTCRFLGGPQDGYQMMTTKPLEYFFFPVLIELNITPISERIEIKDVEMKKDKYVHMGINDQGEDEYLYKGRE